MLTLSLLRHAIAPRHSPRGFGGRRDLLFVGPVHHRSVTPNKDAVSWFALETYTAHGSPERSSSSRRRRNMRVRSLCAIPNVKTEIAVG